MPDTAGSVVLDAHSESGRAYAKRCHTEDLTVQRQQKCRAEGCGKTHSGNGPRAGWTIGQRKMRLLPVAMVGVMKGCSKPGLPSLGLRVCDSHDSVEEA